MYKKKKSFGRFSIVGDIELDPRNISIIFQNGLNLTKLELAGTTFGEMDHLNKTLRILVHIKYGSSISDQDDAIWTRMRHLVVEDPLPDLSSQTSIPEPYSFEEVATSFRTGENEVEMERSELKIIKNAKRHKKNHNRQKSKKHYRSDPSNETCQKELLSLLYESKPETLPSRQSRPRSKLPATASNDCVVQLAKLSLSLKSESQPSASDSKVPSLECSSDDPVAAVTMPNCCVNLVKMKLASFRGSDPAEPEPELDSVPESPATVQSPLIAMIAEASGGRPKRVVMKPRSYSPPNQLRVHKNRPKPPIDVIPKIPEEPSKRIRRKESKEALRIRAHRCYWKKVNSRDPSLPLPKRGRPPKNPSPVE